MTIQELLQSPRCCISFGCCLLAACLLLSSWAPPDRSDQSICFLRQTTGICCPGCGLTRGTAALLKGDFFGAVQKHPLSPLFAIEILIFWVCWSLIAIRIMALPTAVFINRLLALQATLLLLVWGYRLGRGTLPV